MNTNTSEPISSDLLTELLSYDKPVTLESLLILVADTLPRVRFTLINLLFKLLKIRRVIWENTIVQPWKAHLSPFASKISNMLYII